jgi:hypothetical protein
MHLDVIVNLKHIFDTIPTIKILENTALDRRGSLDNHLDLEFLNFGVPVFDPNVILHSR